MANRLKPCDAVLHPASLLLLRNFATQNGYAAASIFAVPKRVDLNFDIRQREGIRQIEIYLLSNFKVFVIPSKPATVFSKISVAFSINSSGSVREGL